MPKDLKELMRHESIATTMKYYVGQNSDATAENVYLAVGRERASGAANHSSAHNQASLDH